MSVTRTKPQRTLRVLSALTARLVVVAVDEGKRHDEYTVSSHDGAVWVSHTADADEVPLKLSKYCCPSTFVPDGSVVSCIP